MTRKHKKRAEISIKTSKFMISHVEPPALAGYHIFSETVLNAIEQKSLFIYHLVILAYLHLSSFRTCYTQLSIL